jgi:hypothetical protein
MKDMDIIDTPNVFCEYCDPLLVSGPGGRPVAPDDIKKQICCKTEVIEPTSDHIFNDLHGVQVNVMCTRPKGHTGKHVACCKFGGTLEGVWTRFHIQWED